METRLPGNFCFIGLTLIPDHMCRSLQDIGDLNFSVDLDAEKGIPPREGRSNSHRVSIRKTTVVNLAAVQAYLDGKMTFDNSVLQAISKLRCRVAPKSMILTANRLS